MTYNVDPPPPQESPPSGETSSVYEYLGKSWATAYKTLRHEGLSEASATAITVALVAAAGEF